MRSGAAAAAANRFEALSLGGSSPPERAPGRSRAARARAAAAAAAAESPATVSPAEPPEPLPEQEEELFYEVRVRTVGPRGGIAEVYDVGGAEPLAALRFKNDDELCSPDFQRRLRLRAAAVLGSWAAAAPSATGSWRSAGEKFAETWAALMGDLSDREVSHPHSGASSEYFSDGAFYADRGWGDGGGGGSPVEDVARAETDEAIAALLQAEEETEAAATATAAFDAAQAAAAAPRGAWARPLAPPPPPLRASPPHGPPPQLASPAWPLPLAAAQSKFPKLPPACRAAAAPAERPAAHPAARRALAASASAARPASPRTLAAIAALEAGSHPESGVQLHLRRDPLAEGAAFLDARCGVRRTATLAAAGAHAAAASAHAAGAPAAGPGAGAAATRQMMAAAGGPAPRAAAAAAAAGAEEAPAEERRDYSTTSVRHLVADMMAAGWNILRAGQHFVYARVLDDAGGVRQITASRSRKHPGNRPTNQPTNQPTNRPLITDHSRNEKSQVLASTSSDRKHLAAARALLRRLDREALELAAEWRAAQAAPS
jgi:hypothetical protein